VLAFAGNVVVRAADERNNLRECQPSGALQPNGKHLPAGAP
jgi:hypothetical protein